MLNLLILPLGIIKNAIKINSIIKKNNIDVIITNTSTIFYASVVSRLHKKEHILIVHEKIPNNFFRNLFFFINEKMSKKVIFVSELNKLEHLSSAKAVVLTLGVESNKLKSLSVIGRSNKNSGLVVSMVGRIHELKGIDLFVDVAEKILKLGKSVVSFRIYGKVGDEVYYCKLKDRIKNLALENSIKFMGFMEINNILAETNVLLLVSRREESPLVVPEAMAAGIPVVAFNVGDVSTYIKNGLNGFIVDAGDVSEVVSNVLFLLNNSSEITRIGESARMFMKKSGGSIFCEELEKIIIA